MVEEVSSAAGGEGCGGGGGVGHVGSRALTEVVREVEKMVVEVVVFAVPVSELVKE